MSLFCKTSSFVPKDAVIVLILPNDFNTNSIINIQGKENLVPVIDFSKGKIINEVKLDRISHLKMDFQIIILKVIYMDSLFYH